MSVLQATSAGVKDMADGSLRITLEFEPRHAKEAYSLFGARGTACAVAALTQDASLQAAQKEMQAEEQKGQPGSLCIMACNFCNDPQFKKWLIASGICAQDYLAEEIEPKEIILMWCEIESRKELDNNDEAANIFHNKFRKPFIAWRNAQQ